MSQPNTAPEPAPAPDWLDPDVIQHPPHWPFDPEYARAYDAWVEWRVEHGMRWR